MYCRKCGKEVPESSEFCPACGASTGNNSSQPVIVNVVNNNTNSNTNINGAYSYIYKSKWTAFFLCFFLGFIGAHRFYVGKNGTAIIWLLTVGFFGLGWLIDLILILIGSFRDKAGYPLR
ncbi:MAG: TM2 domain-containing protein [Clostridia bacterium]|nr:TM2 domain-containing protein [Clostridia bacterium]